MGVFSPHRTNRREKGFINKVYSMAKSLGGINSNEGGVFSNYCKIDMRGQAKHGLWESSMTTGKY